MSLLGGLAAKLIVVENGAILLFCDASKSLLDESNPSAK